MISSSPDFVSTQLMSGFCNYMLFLFHLNRFIQSAILPCSHTVLIMYNI